MSNSQNSSGLVPAICTQCGAQLKVDPNQRVTTCQSCGTEFVTQQAITNYNIYITNNTTINQTVVGKKGAVQSVFEYLDHAGERSHAQYMEQLRKEEEERKKAEEGRKSCLFVIGLFTVPYIAIPVYIASKSKEKREVEEVQRQQRMAVEAAAREQARLQAQERLREIQSKRPTAAELNAILGNIKDARCPCCDAPIAIRMEKPTVSCDYCTSVLPTIDVIQESPLPQVSKQRLIDEIRLRNMEEEERQKQAAEQKAWEEQQQIRAAAESERQRNNSYNSAIIVLSIITGLLLIALINSPFIGAAFFIPALLILCFLLYRRFPEKGKAVWEKIKFPLTCIALFPLPLTAYFNKNEDFKSKFPKAARIGMSIGAWAVYAALVCVLGGLYVKGFRNAVNHTETTQYEVAESSEAVPGTQKSTAQQQTQNKTTTNTSEHTTTAPNEDEIQIPGEQKEQLEFFDNSTNTVVNIGGVSFSIPNNWYENENQKSETSHFYTDNKGKIRIGSLGLYSNKIQSDATTIEELKEEYQKYRDGFLKAALRTMPSNPPLYSLKYNDLTGYFTFASGIRPKQVNDEDIEVDFYLTVIYNPVDHQFITIVMSEFQSSKESYLNDYAQIIDSVRLSSDEEISHTEVSDSNLETTFISEITTEPEPEIYPQEDAFRAAVVAITNALATDVFTSDGSRHDTSKYHSYSDTSAFYMSVLAKGTWTEKNSNTWHVEGLRLQPDGYDTVYNTPINFDTVAKVSLDVTFDGNNYIISNISGMYAIPGKEDIGTNLSYLNSDSMSKVALTVSPNMIANGR